MGTNSVFVIATIAALSGLLFGYDTGVISGALVFMKDQFHLTPEMKGAIVSGVLFGATFSSMVSGQLTDKFGRKKVIFVTALLFAVGSIVTAFANTVELLIAGRVVLGIAIGVASFAAPLYISEISPPAIRGTLVAMNQLMITIGIFVSYLIDYAFTASGNWHAMIAIGCVPAVLLAGGILIVPESARWLVLMGRDAEAEAVLKKVRPGEDVATEVADIKKSLSAEKGDWREFFAPHLRGALVAGVGLGIFQQFSGINTVIYYAPEIYKAAGMQDNSVQILATAGVGLVNVILTVISMFFIDKLGRKPLLYIGCVGMALSLGALSATSLLHLSGDILRIVGVGSTFTYVAFFAMSMGPVFWIIVSEVYPLRIRGFAMSIATAISWLANMIVSFTFPSILANIGIGYTFAGYTVICLAALFFTFTSVPETKGLSLEQIENQERQGALH